MVDLNNRNVACWHTVVLLTAGVLCLAGTAWSASFDVIKPLPGDNESIATAHSDDGSVVVGYGSEAFRWTKATGSIGLGFLPNHDDSRAEEVSADGSVVVGYCDPGEPEAFRWTEASGMISLGFLPGHDRSIPFSVSADGSVVVGVAFSSDGQSEAFRWTEATGMVGLGFLPGHGSSAAHGVSADGSVVVGRSGSSDGQSEAFRWTEATGMVSLGLVPGYSGTDCFDRLLFHGLMSADGSAIAGSAFGYQKEQAFRWSAPTGIQGLGFLSGHNTSYVVALATDGTTVVGMSGDDYNNVTEAFRWTESTGMVSLGFLPDHDKSFPLSVSADGSVVVGDSSQGSQNYAFIWNTEHGMRDLKALLVELGVPMLDRRLTNPWFVSADGLSVIGNNYGQLAWVARGPFEPVVAEGEIVVDPEFALFLDQAVDGAPSAPYTIAIGNTGTGDLNITSVGKTGADSPHFPIASDTGQTVLSPGAERLIDVTFDPSSVGDKQAFLSIESDDPTDPVVHVYLWGHAYAGGEIHVTPTAYTWPYQSIPDAPALPGTVTITNTGAGSLSLSGVALTGTNPGQFLITDDTGETSLSASQSRLVEVAFNPSTSGSKNALLRITSSDADEPTIDVTLTGTGFDPVAGYTTPVWVDPNYVGVEMGTDGQPYNTLAEGVDLVLSGGTVKVKPGACDEVLRITKPMRLEAASASVAIGAPSE